MTDFLQYGAVALWAVLAVLTFIIGRKQGAVGYMLSVFFVFMAVWYGLRAFGKLPVFDGTVGFIFRAVLTVILFSTIGVWYRIKKKQAEQNKDENDKEEENTNN